MKWLLAIVILIVVTIATGGLDLVAVAIAGAIWLFIKEVTK